jgi:tRNA A-37 threonylcarbamoyl transferase component Bud32/MFS family permease
MESTSVGWSFICLLPLILLMGLGVGTFLVLLLSRAAGTLRNVPVSRPLRRILAFGVPAVLFAGGVLGTAMLAERETHPPILTALPLLVAILLAVVSTLVLSKWSYPVWWAHRQRLLSNMPPGVSGYAPPPPTTDSPRGRWPWWLKWGLVVLGGGLLVYGQLTFLNSFSRQEPWPRLNAPSVVVWVIGVIILSVTLPRLVRKWWQKRPGNRPQPEPAVTRGESRITVLHALFTKMGLAIVAGGLVIGVLFAVLTESGILAVTFGGVFVFTVLSLHASQLKAQAKFAAAARPDVVAPLLLTPDPTAVRGDCPTCFTPIPADSPHGLCPRCLIRGAMPSPSSTRLRGVRPVDPPSPAEVNEFFPHLEVLELSGAGGMGAVYKARQPTLDRVVALKIVQSPRGDEDPVFAERFAREARAMAKLDHPNIVTIHESGEAGGLPFLLMEYVDGVTLREAMANRLLTAVEALAVIPQVCDALDYAHRAGVIHRDIKPENILIDQTGRVKIADFGLAKLADPKNVTLTRTQQAMGTPHYMAPEQWERPNDVDHRADVYALGVVLYELLTGELPLGRFALPSEKGKGDARLDQVVVRSLAKDPADRFQNAGQMKAALSGVKLAAFTPAVPLKRRGYEFKSKTRFLGLPLVHVVAGRDPVTGRKRVAKGWIAVGDVMAIGGVAVGGVMGVGVIGVGGVLGVGLLGIGGAVALGLLAAGGNAAGILFAIGGCAASVGLSIGGVAAGQFAIGGEAGGNYVISSHEWTPGFGAALRAWFSSFWPFS